MISKKQCISQEVRKFYNFNPFPNFNVDKYVSCEDLKEQSSWFYELLDLYIPIDKKIIDVGCGTDQLSCFLAIKGRETLGVDSSDTVLNKANFLKKN